MGFYSNFLYLRRPFLLLAAVLAVACVVVPKSAFPGPVDCIQERVLAPFKRAAAQRRWIESQLHDSQIVLGRKLSPTEERALRRIIPSENRNFYTPDQIEAEAKYLAKSGMAGSEISLLRRKGVLGKWGEVWADPKGSGTALSEQNISSMGPEVLARLIEEKRPLQYFVDSHHQLHLIEGNLKPDLSKFLVIRSAPGSSSTGSYLARETGTMSYNGKAGRFEFRPQYLAELEDPEIASQAKQVAKTHLPVSGQTLAASVQKSRVLSCMDILTEQSTLKTFVRDVMIGENAVFVIGAGLSELNGAGRMESPAGREVLLADWIGINTIMPIDSIIRRKLAFANTGLFKSFLHQSMVGLPEVGAQNLIYKSVLDENPDSRANQIAIWDSGYMTGYYWAIGAPFNKYVVNQLPKKLSEMCLSGRDPSIVISSTAIRFYERAGYATLYYLGREKVLDE